MTRKEYDLERLGCRNHLEDLIRKDKYIRSLEEHNMELQEKIMELHRINPLLTGNTLMYLRQYRYSVSPTNKRKGSLELYNKISECLDELEHFNARLYENRYLLK